MIETLAGSSTAYVSWEMPIVNDNSEETLTAWTAGFSSGYEYPIGAYEVLYRATDSSGNTGYCVIAFEVVGK